jgi:DNA modification methylase
VRVKRTEWAGCYGKSLNGFIVPEAFQHPAKYSLALIERIYDHMLDRGWLQLGDVVGDPFGGVAIGGLVAAYRKLQWVGVEIEPRFVTLADLNIAKHQSRLTAIGAPIPRIFRGDSRKFAHHVNSVVTSPPYGKTLSQGGGPDTDLDKSRGGGSLLAMKQGYGKCPGQIDGLPIGSIDSVVSSPPYADSIDRKSGIDPTKLKRCVGPNSNTYHAIYGKAEGQIGRLKAVVSSPPYANIAAGAGGLNTKPAKKPGQQSGRSAKSESQQADQRYGDAQGQIAQLKSESYWQAMHQVYSQCYAAIKPGGVIAIVVKDYCKDRKIVPLCDDTAKLLEHVGFKVIERARAMLVSQTSESDLFLGATQTTRERKSFFRRLYEKAGGPKIDFEEVIFARKV